MSGIGARLREERERLRLSQAAFGKIGGVQANAQGKYESGERFPNADYLESLAVVGVDVLYVLSGSRTPLNSESFTAEEEEVISSYRLLEETDKLSVRRLLLALSKLKTQTDRE